MSIIALSPHDALVWTGFGMSVVAAVGVALVGDHSRWLSLLLWVLVIGCAVVAGLG